MVHIKKSLKNSSLCRSFKPLHRLHVQLAGSTSCVTRGGFLACDPPRSLAVILGPQLIRAVLSQEELSASCLLSFLCVLSLQSCPALCDPTDRSPPGNSVHGIVEARLLEWVAMPFSRGSSQPRYRTQVSCIPCTGRWLLYHCVTWKALRML